MNIYSLRENILSALPLSMAKKYEMLNRELNTNKEEYYYKVFKKLYDKAFGKDEKGKPIYRKYINVDNKPIDKEIYSFLKQNGYSITEEEFNTGVIIKNKDDKNNHLSLEELQKKGMVLKIGRILNKKKAPQNLILKWDRISKEISNKKLIVISRHPYDIAGQSTDRSWESCMTLKTDKQEEGCNSMYVNTGIEAGVLIAYLISNDDKNINKPLARVLIKPLINVYTNKVYLVVSKIYGVAGEEFRKSVEKWVNKNLNKKIISGKYYLDINIYNDNDSSDITIITKEYLKNTRLIDMYNDNGIVYDKKTNTLYIMYNKYFRNNALVKARVKKESISDIVTIERIKKSKTLVYENNILYKSNTEREIEDNFNFVLLINNEVVTDFKIKNILYKIDKDGNILYKNNSINIDDNTIYIYKKLNNENYKGFDYSNFYTIKYVDKIKATNDNIKKLVNNLDISLRDIDVSNVTDMSYLFKDSSRIDFTGIENWDVSNVENMNSIFSNSKFNRDISNWNVSNVRSMSYMFFNNNFNGDISNWDVSNVKYMNSMFKESSFNGDISKWNTSNVETMNSMFAGSNFNGDISKWNTSNVRNMRYMFYQSNFNKNISKWNVSSVIDMFGMFERSKFNKDISNWDTSNVENMSNMFNFSKFNQDISNWNVSSVENMEKMFANSKFNKDISNWDISSVRYTENMFYNSNFNGDLSKWNTINIRYMDNMFDNSPLENNPPKWYKE